MSRVSRIFVIAIAAAGAFLSLSTSAMALVTVGQTAPSANTPLACEDPNPFDEFQTAVVSGASYAVPTSGVLTSWSTNNTFPLPGQTLGMNVLRPAGPGKYLVVAHDGPRPLTANLNTFPVSIPVQAGDIVGLAVPPGEAGTGGILTICQFETGNAGDKVSFSEMLTADGATLTANPTPTEKIRVNVSATLLPPPTITAVSPVSGPVTGGTRVALSGTNFAAVKSVTFGGVPGTSPTATSEGQLTVTVPPSAALASVPVTVTTAAGSATASTGFTYEGCKVPKVVGKKLKVAKKVLSASKCALGKVKKRRFTFLPLAKVSSQSPQPGQVLPVGSKVNVKVR
jgi:hypothetical protein